MSAKPSTITRQSERGNVLWFIMIAIVFIGLITMVLTRSSSTVDQTADLEQASIKIGQVLRYAKSIEAAIEEMKLRGVSESDVSFENDETTTNYTNPNCSSTDCMLFDVGGAGLAYRAPPAGVNDGSEWIFTGDNNVGSINDPIGTTAARSGNDLMMLMPHANESFCVALNRQLRVETSGAIPVDNTGISTGPFVGIYDNNLVVLDGDPSPLEFDGQPAGCFTDPSTNPDTTYFYYVVLSR